jgi:orotidine-5'-phosphate decarboxylase
VGYHVRGEHAATATFTVVRRRADVPATCRLQATAADHAVVGQWAVTVRAGASTSTVRATLRTERRATTVGLVGCTSAAGSPSP